jgi:uncharacterized membrane protein
MKPTRLEAFSDGVIAVIITIMVLELKVPAGTTLQSLTGLLPIFLSYVLSFIYVGIYWNNHHHLFHAVKTITGRVLWANLHLLFWLSLIPFLTGWLNENPLQSIPTALYGFVLFMASVAYFFLTRALIAIDSSSELAEAVGSDRKGIASCILYIIAIIAACSAPWLATAIYILVAAIWFVPDRRIERTLTRADEKPKT